MENIKERIDKLGNQASSLDSDIKILESQLEQKKEELKIILEKNLPDLLENEGITVGSSIVLSDGAKIILKDYLNCSIPSISSIEKEKDIYRREELEVRRKECFEWLKQNELADIIKNEVDIDIGKNSETAKKVLKWVEEENLCYKHEEKVHPATLKATIKELLEQGKEVPFDKFEIRSGSVVVLDKK